MKFIPLAVLSSLLVFGVAHAADKTLTEDQVKAKIEAAGYTNVHEIEREGKHFDAEATKDGNAVHLHVDASSGAVTPAPNEDEEHEEHEKHEKHKHS